MPNPYPNLPPSTDPTLKEYIRLLHSSIEELESKINKLNSNHNKLTEKIDSLEKINAQ